MLTMVSLTGTIVINVCFNIAADNSVLELLHLYISFLNKRKNSKLSNVCIVRHIFWKTLIYNPANGNGSIRYKYVI